MKRTPILCMRLLVAALFVLALFRPGSAFALSTVTITPGGDAAFLLQGTGIADAAALEINILYDAGALVNPRVVEGPLIAGAMTAVNQSLPGMVRMVIIRLTPIRGSGVIATLSFDRRGSAAGAVTSASVKLADSTGAPLPALVQIVGPHDSAADANALAQDDSPSGPAATARAAGVPPAPPPSALPATVIIAGQRMGGGGTEVAPDAPLAGERSAQPSSLDSAGGPAPELAAREQKDAPAAQTENGAARSGNASKTATYTQKSVLERFKEYRGARSVAAFVSLFGNESMIGCRQEPPVSLSDGSSVVRVLFVSAPGADPSSAISVMGARLLALKKDPDNTNAWIAELVPEKGAYRASLAVSQGGRRMVFPLVIAPKGLKIKIRRAYYAPDAVKDRGLRVEDIALIVINFHPCPQQFRKRCPPCIMSCHYIAFIRQEYLYLNAPFHRTRERVYHPPARSEVCGCEEYSPGSVVDAVIKEPSQFPSSP